MRAHPMVALVFGAFAAALGAQQSVEELVVALGSDDGRARQRAYQELQRRRDPATVGALAGRIGGFPRGGQQLAIYLLRALPIDDTRALYRELAAEAPPFVRVGAAAELLRKQDPRALERLVEVMRALPEKDRVAATNHFYGLHDPGFHEALLAWLHPGADAGLIRAVLVHLHRQGKFDAARARAAVTPLAASDDVSARVAALAWLARSDRARADELAALLKEDGKLFWPVRDLLDTDAPLGGAMLAALTAALEQPRSKLDVQRLAKMLQRQSPGTAAAPLRELLENDKEGIRAAALAALATIPGALTDKDLRAMLRSDDAASALTAADMLRRRDDPSGLDVVLTLLPDAGKHRAEAAKVLGRFRDPRAAAPLLELLEDRDVAVRRNAWSGLQQLMRGLYPYRRFDFANCGYRPDAGARADGVRTLRAWWDAATR